MSSRGSHPAGSARVEVRLDIHPEGTFYQGDLLATYQELLARFGNPIKTGDGKGRVEWVLSTPYGVATVYDWKVGYIELENLDHWHIGGMDDRVVAVVQGLFP